MPREARVPCTAKRPRACTGVVRRGGPRNQRRSWRAWRAGVHQSAASDDTATIDINAEANRPRAVMRRRPPRIHAQARDGARPALRRLPRLGRPRAASSAALVERFSASERLDEKRFLSVMSLALILHQRKLLFAAAEEQVPMRVAAEDASTLLEGVLLQLVGC